MEACTGFMPLCLEKGYRQSDSFLMSLPSYSVCDYPNDEIYNFREIPEFTGNNELISVFKDIAKGLRCLHREGKTYHKLKLSNIIVVKNKGYLKNLENEHLSGESQTATDNLWRFGKCLYKLFSKTDSEVIPHIEPHYSKEDLLIGWEDRSYGNYLIKNLTIKLLSSKPEDRGTAEELYASLKDIVKETPKEKINQKAVEIISNFSFKDGCILKSPDKKEYVQQISKMVSDYFFSNCLDSLSGNPQDVYKLDHYKCILKTTQIGYGNTKKVFDGAVIKFNPEDQTISMNNAAVAISTKIDSCNREDQISDNFNSPHVVKRSSDSIVTLYESLPTIIMAKELLPLMSKYFYSAPIDQKISFFLEAVIGIKEIHDKDFVHRDIKPENIGAREINLEGGVKKHEAVVFDLELAVNIKDHIKEFRGTLLYLAPELLGGPFCVTEPIKPIDIWALGICMYEMFHPLNRLPFFLYDLNTKKFSHYLLERCKDNEHINNLFVDWSDCSNKEKQIQELIKKLLSLDPSKRPTAGEVVAILETLNPKLEVEQSKA